MEGRQALSFEALITVLGHWFPPNVVHLFTQWRRLLVLQCTMTMLETFIKSRHLVRAHLKREALEVWS
jgi:hypothetical protein